MPFSIDPIDCEMGEWITRGECRCEHETPCLLRDGSPGLPYSSGETCRRKQTKSVMKRGKYGGRNDCKRIHRTKICTAECKYITCKDNIEKKYFFNIIYLTMH